MKDTQPVRVRFGVFELDLKSGDLRNADHRTLLQEQPLQVLRMLVERGGQLVTRPEIKRKLWPNDTIVEFDHSINTVIRNLRRALSDSADEPKYIETVARRGYRLLVPVEPLPVVGGQLSEPSQAAVVPAEFQPAVLTGRTVSHYRVLDIIGGGGMGVVYRAEDLKLGRQVALKFLPEELGSEPQALERFSREARAASSLDHPNICPIFEFGEHEGRPFMVMQLLEGQTLRDRLAAHERALPLAELLDIGIQVSEGLQAAHEKGIIHRDIKPANIFLTSKGVVKILDFGLAKLVEAEAHPSKTGLEPALSLSKGGAPAGVERGFSPASAAPLSLSSRAEVAAAATGVEGPAFDSNHENAGPSTARPPVPQKTRDGEERGRSAQDDSVGSDDNIKIGEHTLTRTGIAMGTAGYMSPEQVRGEKLDARTDIFSFGLVLYEMATGQRAFSGETAAVVHDAILNRSPIPVRELNSTLPAKLTVTIDKALEKDREKRYQSAAAMHSDLKRLQRGRQFVIPEIPASRRWRWLTTAALLLAVMAGGWLYWRSRNTIKLTANDTIVLGDFTNTTGDPVLSDALNLALDTELSQTPSLTRLSLAKRQQGLKTMGVDAFAQLTPELGLQLCRGTNSKAFVEPSVSDAGDRYQVVLRTVNCQNGKTIATTWVQAERRSDLVKMVGVAGHQVRQILGESKESLNTFNVPIETLESASPEAIQAYVQARSIATRKGDREALPYAKRAVELDPLYAHAYEFLGALYDNLSEETLMSQAVTRAYELRDRLGSNSRYRLGVEAHYYQSVRGDLEKALQSHLRLIQLFPNSAVGYANAGSAYASLGESEKAVPQYEEAIRLYPDGVFPYWNLMYAHLALNQFDDAKSVFERAAARKLDADELRDARYLLAFLQGDRAAMQEQVKWAVGKANAEDMLMGEEAHAEAYHGRYVRARALTQQAINAAVSGSREEHTADRKMRQAWREVEAGNTLLARKVAAEALKLKLPHSARTLAALVLARNGETGQAGKIADELDREFPQDTIIQGYWLPSIRAAIALDVNDPQEAIRALAPAATYELTLTPAPTMQTVYLRGLAYLKAGQGAEAAAEFQKIISHPGVVLNYVTGTLARLQLGRAQVMMGDTTAARKSYQEFLTLWKDADPDIPIYKQAKTEYAKIRD